MPIVNIDKSVLYFTAQILEYFPDYEMINMVNLQFVSLLTDCYISISLKLKYS
jgi:hypothetical protein